MKRGGPGRGAGGRGGAGARGDRGGGPKERGGRGDGPGGRGDRSGGSGARGRSGASAPRRDTREARVVWPPPQRHSAREAIEELMRERGLARRFEGAVEHAARRACARGLDVPVGGPPRRDLRELPTFTIDPVSARDFDDAISAEWLRGGRAVRVWVHIADVSAYVREGSPLDLEARLRGTSVYVPGAVEPMLPHALSSDSCSLMPARDRLAVTVELEVPLDDAGRPPGDGADLAGSAGAGAPGSGSGAGGSGAAGGGIREDTDRSAPAASTGGTSEPRFYRSLVRSDARLDYDQVDRIFAGADHAAEPWAEPLTAARAAARALGHARTQRPGNLYVDSEEPEFEFDERGEVAAIRARPQTESHRLIEHLMIAANEAVAQTLRDHGVPTLYRVHERPHVESVLRLLEQLATLEVPTPPVPDGLTRAGAAELVGEISLRVEEHVRRTAARARAGDRGVSPTGGRRALTALVLRSLQQAHYSPRNLGHAGLGSSCYCHFTSPIRRYPDLVCHRALLSLLGYTEHAPRAAHLEELGAWCSERERGAMEIERDGHDIARCFALERLLYREGPDLVFAGEVVGLIGAGAFVAFGGHPAPVDGQTTEYTYEGLLPVRLLSALAAAREAQGGGERAPSAATGRAAAARTAHGAGGPRSGAPRGRTPGPRSARASRDWWDLNEQGTVLSGQRSGATLRLGDPIAVRVERVDAPRGRVDLLPAELAPVASPTAPSGSPTGSPRAGSPRAGSGRAGSGRSGSGRSGPPGPRGGQARGGR